MIAPPRVEGCPQQLPGVYALLRGSQPSGATIQWDGVQGTETCDVQEFETIVETADRVGADMVVMSTHALTGPARALLGSVADEVVRAARRPVLLVPQHQQVVASRPAEAHDRAMLVM